MRVMNFLRQTDDSGEPAAPRQPSFAQASIRGETSEIEALPPHRLSVS